MDFIDLFSIKNYCAFDLAFEIIDLPPNERTLMKFSIQNIENGKYKVICSKNIKRDDGVLIFTKGEHADAIVKWKGGEFFTTIKFKNSVKWTYTRPQDLAREWEVA